MEIKNIPEMIVERNKHMNTEYTCELTKYLDVITGVNTQYLLYRHYILLDKSTIACPWREGIAIRVPGCTIGGIIVDKEWKIVRIKIYTDSIIKYPSDIEDQLKKFIGVKIVGYEDL